MIAGRGMDDHLLCLYYIHIMNTFRSTYYIIEDGESDDIRIEVIAYHHTSRDLYRAPRGLPAYRLMTFHTPMKVFAAQDSWAIKPHTLFLFPPDTHTTYGIPGRPWSSSWIRLNGSRAGSLMTENDIPANRPVPFGSSKESDRWLALLHAELQRADRHDSVVVEHLLCIWLRQIRRRLPRNRSTVPVAFVGARQYIETHYLESLTLGSLADHARLSRQHFCEGFRKYFGVTPIDYVIRLRVRHAVELLSNIDLNITEISARCGFKDVYYFSRVFKNRMGLSPSVYRRDKLGLR
jgi:AraC-like DNA-binding protein